ncbi:MAG: FAD-dependent oxidoreductase [Kiritimatiellae bacterium]|nr:FAD-dependent oxidoreductase [Kiritimatiellia bacterium]
MSEHCVIIGAGHGAAQLCASLRKDKWEGPITLIGDEPSLPYHRPPLSKSQLNPKGENELQFLRAKDFYECNDIKVLTSTWVDSVHAAQKEIVIGDQRIAYDKLVLAVGSTHRTPPIQGVDDPHVFALRTAEDADAMREAISDSESAVIIGAGFIGLEVAASLRKLGLDVSVIEVAPRVLVRVASEDVSAFFEKLHTQNGVTLHTGSTVSAIENNGEILTVIGDDLSIDCDFVVMGTGAAASTALAESAGLTIDNGIVVNEYNQTSDPNIYALGDCCNQHSSLYATPLRLESVQNAVDQAKTVAAALTGNPVAHTALPWFWSDQYDVKLQIAGVSTGYDRVVLRGTPEPGERFSAWYFKGDRLLAVDAINDTKAYALGSKLLNSGCQPNPELLANPSVEGREVLTQAKETSGV